MCPSIRSALTVTLTLASLALAPIASAQSSDAQPSIESSKTVGDYEILYSLVPTTFISADVAAANQIVRGKDQAMINVSVRKKVGGGDVAQTAIVKGTYSDLMQSKTLTFREVREKDALYYLAVFRHGDKEFLRFDLNVQIHAQTPAQQITFSRKLFIDEPNQ